MARPRGKRAKDRLVPVGTSRGRYANIVSFALTVAAALAQAWALVSLGRGLGALAEGVPASGLILASLTFAVLAGACQVAVELVSRTSATREEARLRNRLLDHLLRLGPASASHLRSGSTVSLLTDGVERVGLYRQTFVAPTAAAVAAPMLVLILIGATIDPLFAAVLLIPVVLVPPFILALHLRLRRSSSGSRRQRLRLAGEYLDAIQGLSALALARATWRTAESLRATGEDNRRAVMGLLAGNQLVILFTDGLFTLFFITGSVATALLRLRGGAVDLGDALALVMVAFVLLEPLDRVGAFFYVGMGGLANQRAARRILGTTRPRGAAPEDEASVVHEEASDGHAEVSLSRVTATWAQPERADGAHSAREHGPGHPGGPSSAQPEPPRAVLEEVDLTVDPGQHLALVGPSGAGKSTLVSLLAGDLLPAAGTVRVGGVASTADNQDLIRAHSALVAQSTWLFAGTIADNLRIAEPQASEERMWWALEQANLADEVRRMPEGLATVVGDNGMGLSGGQAQRVSLARAFLADRPLLLLDEPTSQVDLAGEALINEAIERLSAGRTVVTVSHRHSAIEGADRVIRVSDGVLSPLSPTTVESR